MTKLEVEWIRNELLILRSELESAIKAVKENDSREWLSQCRCQQNAFANTKFGFAVGYAKSSCQRILNKLERE